MGEAKEIWKRLFFVLHNNKQPDDDLPTMWTPFKAGSLQDGDLETAIESISHLLPDNVREKLKSLCNAKKAGKANSFYSMQALCSKTTSGICCLRTGDAVPSATT